MLSAVLSVALVALSLALDTFAVCVGVGVRGVTRGATFRLGAAFATAEVVMNLIGAGLGTLAGRAIGDVAAYFGFAALFGVGVYMVVEAVREGDQQLDLSRGFGLLIAAFSMSLDSLGIGFSIVYLRVPIVVTLVAIAFASVTSTTLGLGLGRRFGVAVGERAGLAAGFILMGTGALFALLRVKGIG